MSCNWCGNKPARSQFYTVNGHHTVLCEECIEWNRTSKRCIVTLCGSTRFIQDFQDTNFEYTMKGYIVLSIGCDTKRNGGIEFTEEQKRALDRLHMDKISMANLVVVLNRNGYIGESTRREIAWAENQRKNIIYKFPKLVELDQ